MRATRQVGTYQRVANNVVGGIVTFHAGPQKLRHSTLKHANAETSLTDETRTQPLPAAHMVTDSKGAFYTSIYGSAIGPEQYRTVLHPTQ